MVKVGVPRGTMLPDAPYWIDDSGDVWMALPNATYVMIDYHSGQIRWISDEPATLAGIKRAGFELRTPIDYTQAMVTILLKVINRFEGAMRSANLI